MDVTEYKKKMLFALYKKKMQISEVTAKYLNANFDKVNKSMSTTLQNNNVPTVSAPVDFKMLLKYNCTLS